MISAVNHLPRSNGSKKTDLSAKTLRSVGMRCSDEDFRLDVSGKGELTSRKCGATGKTDIGTLLGSHTKEIATFVKKTNTTLCFSLKA